MKLTVRFDGLSKRDVQNIEYHLGPCADDEYIADPRDQIHHFKPGYQNSLTLTVNVPAERTIEEIAAQVEAMAFQLSNEKRRIAGAA